MEKANLYFLLFCIYFNQDHKIVYDAIPNKIDTRIAYFEPGPYKNIEKWNGGI